MPREFNQFIDEARESSLRAYQERTGWIEGHYGIEQTVVGGGYEFRQVLELVQNGADAILESSQYGHSEASRVSLLLRGGYLYAANTGTPITRDGIEALLDSHRSSKRQNQIGRFGLGFKSLLKLGGRIDVCSRTVAFTFDPERCRSELRQRFQGRFAEHKAPGLRLAWTMADHEAAEVESLFPWATTVIRAEILEESVVSKLRDKIASFPTEFLLFLPVPIELRLDDGINGERLLRCERSQQEAILHDAESSSRWQIKEELVSISDLSAISDATDIHARAEVPISWAIPMDRKRDEAGRFWAFFPTETATHLPGILNAPWKVDSARDTIIAGEWNTGLMRKAAKMIAGHLPGLSSSSDPGRPLDYFPRQREGDLAVALINAVWESLVQTPIIPDATAQAELRTGSELWRHPGEKAELAAEWVDLASPEQRARMVHPSCYLSTDRISRLKALAKEIADRLVPNPGVVDHIPNLRSRAVSDWFADVGTKEAEIARKVLKLAEVYSSLNPQLWNTERLRLAIIPSASGELMRPDQLFLSTAAENTSGLPLVASFLSQDREGRRLVTEVMKVRALDEQQWLTLLMQALNSVGAPRTADAPWRDLWNKLRAAPTNIRDSFLGENKAKVRVKRRDGQWVVSDEALLSGRIVSEDDTNDANKLMLVDLDMHRGDEELLSNIGVSDFPLGDNGPGSHAAVLKENGNLVSEWLYYWRRQVRQMHPNPADPSFLEPKLIAMPKGWPLLATLKDNANVVLTKVLLEWVGATAFSPTITFCHRNNQHYPPTPVPHALLWLIDRYGQVAIGNACVRVAAFVKHRDTPAASLIPEWNRFSTAVAFLTKTEPHTPATTKDSQVLWNALIEFKATPAALDADELRDLWTAAANSGVVPPSLPWHDGVVSLHEIFVSESSELTRRARTSGRLAVTLDAATLKTWIESGAQGLDHLLKPQFEDAALPAPLITVFPELSSVLHDDFRETASCQPVSNLQLCLDGHGESVACLFWKGTLLADRSQLSSKPRSEMLRLLIAELAGARWLNLEPQAAFNALWDDQVEGRRRMVRECLTLPERLFEAVGRNRDRLLEVLGDLRGMAFLEGLTGERVADVVLSLLGTATLSKLHSALEANGLKPPGRWSSDEGRAFVEKIGFGPEFAASSTARRDAEEFISGPIKLPPLHDYQGEVYEGLRMIISNGPGRRRGVVSLPTGGGKTRVVVQASVELILNPETGNRTVLWVAQTDELCEQAVQAFRQVWINRGLPSTDLRICRMWGGTPNPRKPELGMPTVIVASIQTLSGRVGSPDLEWLTKPGMMVVDECHHAITKSYTNVLRWLGAEGKAQNEPEHEEPAIIGLSATPFRGNVEASAWLANRFDNKLLPNDPGSLYAKLRHDRVLALEEYEALKLPTQLPTALRTKLEELAARVASDEMPEGIELLEEINQQLAVDEKRNDKLLKAVAQRVAEHPQTSILFFCNSVLHAGEMAARLHLQGIAAAAISGETPSPARRDFLEKFKDGRIKVLCNHSVLTTGFDAPKTDMILIARQVFSRVRYMQMVGRGLRGPQNGGTEHCKIVTVDDNLERFDNARHGPYCRDLWTSLTTA